MALDLTPMKMLQVVVPGDRVEPVRELLTSVHVSGYTVIPNVSGMGHHGYHEGRLLFNDASAQSMIVSVIQPGALEPLLEGLLPLLERRSGVAWVSDVMVARAEYFAPEP